MLIKESESEEETKSLIQTIELASQNLTETLDELIETLLIKQDINKERVLLSFENTFINAQEILKEKIEEADAKVTFDFSNAPKIMYPKIYLDSILLNLLSNAIKYGSIKRTTNIHFSTVNINGSIILTAKDNGLGIDLKKYGEKLFGLRETFHQSVDAKGIGLFMTKLQVEAMGGQITVDSEVDKGTEFKIVFNIEQLQDL
jgi:signal transduction histidine kinase